MTRVKRGVIHTKKRKKILRLAKGYREGRSKLYTLASEALKKALSASYRGRKRRKRDFRRLWIARINAAARKDGLPYSLFIRGLKKTNIGLNRQILSELAVNNPSEFQELVKKAKKGLEE
ncbi:50S ribosomal protein L20 [Candidatus Aerophobetes bacterium]|uniref:Large ribosomal subunit protein bL20 n=1 Tax=Aerophobetes bacterium TaxID=2030807 RepID=A0A523RP69_UNCAE|nr:MAG: 50S ribosomal protein L20 [Candidatus Aerophobetes bacterium]